MREKQDPAIVAEVGQIAVAFFFVWEARVRSAIGKVVTWAKKKLTDSLRLLPIHHRSGLGRFPLTAGAGGKEHDATAATHRGVTGRLGSHVSARMKGACSCCWRASCDAGKKRFCS